jgi:hypothetical protein
VATNSCPSFTVSSGDAIGAEYVIDVTDDVEAWRNGSTPNQGWALYHIAAANIQDFTGTANYGTVSYRPLLTVTYDTGGGTAYTLTVNGGNGSGDYPEATAVPITAYNAPAGQVFAAWIGDVAGVADINASSTTLTMPAVAQTITATYSNLPLNTLTVNKGTGDGSYYSGQVVSIVADAPPIGKVFDAWTGDTAGIASLSSMSTTYTMPASVATVTAAYVLPTVYTVATNGTADYTSINEAFEAAMTLGTHVVVKIMDSGVYNEEVYKVNGGIAGASITVCPDTGQTPSVYAVQMYNNACNITFEGLIIDGGLRDYTDSGSGATAQLVTLRAGKADYTVKDCTIKGHGTSQSVYLYSGIGGKTWTLDGNIFEADSFGVDTMGINAGEANISGSLIVVKNNTITDSRTYIWYSTSMTTNSGSVIFEYNIFDGCKQGIYNRKIAAGISNMTIVHNTFNKIAGGDLYTGGAIDMRDSNDGNFGPEIRDNLFVGTGGTDFDGLNNGQTMGLTDINANYNGFYNMNSNGIACFSSVWKSIADLNGYVSSGNNIINGVDPFADSDFHLISDNWATTAASDGGYIGALPALPNGSIFKFK